MPCDTRALPGQTLTQRKKEVLESIVELNALLVAGKVTAKVGPQGAITFIGWNDDQRRRVSDACAYRQIMAIGQSLARAKIAQAEMLAGRSVSKQAVAIGAHSHDSGLTWHTHKG